MLGGWILFMALWHHQFATNLEILLFSFVKMVPSCMVTVVRSRINQIHAHPYWFLCIKMNIQ